MNEMPCGFINIHKPKGMTSHDVVNRVRRLLNIKKVGHAGTLDPNATGVLLVGVGRATKYIQYLEILDKVYEAELILGMATDTDDVTGNVLERGISAVNRTDLENVLALFKGTIDQIPPAYSAIKINGRKCYDYARKGIELEIPSRKITIHELSCIDDTKLPDAATLRVHCSKGTYIRSLCRDIGGALSMPACMGDLIRTRIGPYKLESALTLEALEKICADGVVNKCLISPNEALSHFKAVQVSERGMHFVPNGGILYPWNSETSFDDFEEGELLRFMGSSGFIGLGQYTASDQTGYPAVVPVKLL